MDKKTIKTETLNELAKKELAVFDSLYNNDGVYDLKTAAELNNTTGKIINIVRLQLEMAKYLKENPKGLFLNK